MNEPLLSKQSLRTQIITQLKTYAWFLPAWNDSLQIQLLRFLKKQQGLWTAFVPLKTEPQIQELLAHPELSHLQWAFPVVRDQVLEFYIPGPHGFVPGPQGNMEPVLESAQSVPLSQIHGSLIPGLAFDLTGRRLGRGGGFFDQTLKSFLGKKVGVAFGPQIYSQIPTEEHDLQVESLVSDQGILHFSKVRSA